MIKQRELLLIPFPFSDQSGRKVRPVIVISNEEFNDYSEDIIVVGVTSNVSKERYSVPVTNAELEEGKLFTPSIIKSENILKIDREIIIRKIGRINEPTFKKVRENILKIIS